MCILCVAARSARRLLGVLPWFLVSMGVVWAVSLVFAPAFRFEMTSARVGCVVVLCVTLVWYEVLYPGISDWQLRRRARLREKRRIEELAAAKRLKMATRRCPNCDTPYVDQTSPKWNRKKKCERCGVISKNPKKEIQGFFGSREWAGHGWIGTQLDGLDHHSGRESDVEGSRDRLRMNGENGWVTSGTLGRDQSKSPTLIGRVAYGGDRHFVKGFVSGIHTFVYKIIALLVSSTRRAWRKIRWGGSLGENEDLSLDASQTSIAEIGEEGAAGKKSKGERARRKAEEKRRARELKEKEEEQEKMSREVIAKLVEEYRRLKEEREVALQPVDSNKEVRKMKDADRRGRERTKQKDRGSSKDTVILDGEDIKRRACRESEKKCELDNKDENGKQEMTNKAALENANVMENLRAQVAIKARHSGYLLNHRKSPSQSPSRCISYGSLGMKISKQMKSGEPSHIFQPGSPSKPMGSESTKSSSAWNRVGVPKTPGKGTCADSENKSSSLVDTHCPEHGRGRPNVRSEDNKRVVPEAPVSYGANQGSPMGVKQSPTKPWNQLFSGWHDNISHLQNHNHFHGAGSVSVSDQASPPSFNQGYVMFESIKPAPIGPTTSNSFNRSPTLFPGFGAESVHEVEDPSYRRDPNSLLGPVSESLYSCPLDPGTRNLPIAELEGFSQFMHGPSSAANKWPGPIASPVSAVLPLGVPDKIHPTLSQHPSITESWVPASLSFDGPIGAGDRDKWQMWDTPELCPNELVFSSNPCRSLCSSTQAGHHSGGELAGLASGSSSDYAWVKCPSIKPASGHNVENCHYFDSGYLENISRGGEVANDVIPDGSSEQSQAIYWPEKGSEEGDSRDAGEQDVPKRPHIGGIYTDPDVESIWLCK